MAVATITLNKTFLEVVLRSSVLVTTSYTGSTSTVGDFPRACSGLRSINNCGEGLQRSQCATNIGAPF